jgi:hypothetical protein
MMVFPATARSCLGQAIVLLSRNSRRNERSELGEAVDFREIGKANHDVRRKRFADSIRVPAARARFIELHQAFRFGERQVS